MVQIDALTMKTTNKDCYRLIPFLLLALLIYIPAQADTVLQGHTIVHYNKVASDQLSVDIRPLDAVPIGRVSARLGDIELPVTKVADYPSNQQRTGILFLVDTSDPRRQQAVDRSIAHIEQLLAYNKPHYQYGLARFDTDLHFLQPGVVQRRYPLFVQAIAIGDHGGDHAALPDQANDPGESAKNGMLITSNYGKGHFTYTGISFFRQLPAGVPGAYRLFANLISLGQ